MNIVAILGSPRPAGASSTMARRFLAAAETRGATTQTFVLNQLNYRGCQACYVCKTVIDTCVLKDDLREVLAAVHAADVLVLATPVYYGDVTGQLKSYVDRTFSFLTADYRTSSMPSRLAPGKKLVFIQTQGQADGAFFADLFPRYQNFLKRQGFSQSHLLRACGVTTVEDVLSRAELLQQIEETAALVAGR